MKIRTSSKVIGALAAGLCLFVAACTSPSEEAAPSAASAPSAPPAAGQPESSQPAAAVSAGDELYIDVEADPEEGAPPLAVQFTAMVEDNTGAVDCEWDFGDGAPKKTGLNPMHVFSTVEDYEVVVRCKDSAGVEGEGDVDIFVED